MVVSHACGVKYMWDHVGLYENRLHLYLLNHYKIVTLEVYPILRPKNHSWRVIFPWYSHSISIISHENRHSYAGWLKYIQISDCWS